MTPFLTITLCLLCGSAGALLGPMFRNVVDTFKKNPTKVHRESAGVLLPPPLTDNSIPQSEIPRDSWIGRLPPAGMQ